MFNVSVRRIQRIPVKESRDKVEEHLSPTCCTSDRSSQEGDSIFYSPISSDSDTTKASIADSKWSCILYVAASRGIYLFIFFCYFVAFR